MAKVSIIIGTRPEAIKMAPVYKALKKQPALEVRLVSTGQHRDLVPQSLSAFGLNADADLDVMRPDQSLTQLTARLLNALDRELGTNKPDLVLSHGDTTTCFATSLASFYRKIPLFHVEAGLRTFRLDSPFPEEFNRQMVGHIATHHFAPSDESRSNLLAEGVEDSRITVTGSTILDALAELMPKDRCSQLKPTDGKPLILLTLHRRETGGASLQRLLEAVRRTALNKPDAIFVFPVHPNPNLREAVFETLDGIENVSLLPPLPYPEFLKLLLRSSLVVTDSGGVQEEASFACKRVLVVRDRTERENGIATGLVRVVGTDPRTLQREIEGNLVSVPREHDPFLPKGFSSSPAEIIADAVARRCGA